MLIPILYFLFPGINSITLDEKNTLCLSLPENCTDELHNNEVVCGIKSWNGSQDYRVFDNICELLKYGCAVSIDEAYGMTKMEDCINKTSSVPEVKTNTTKQNCSQYKCKAEKQDICGVRLKGNDFETKIFHNLCFMKKHNCEGNPFYYETETRVCHSNNVEKSALGYHSEITDKSVPIVIVSLNNSNNINESVSNYFEMTHKNSIRLKKVSMDTRRHIPLKRPPDNIYETMGPAGKNATLDSDHEPLLQSCYHKCPKKCPPFYEPVCALSGEFFVEEPVVMFQNHCFMDMAQCKSYNEMKSPTAKTGGYASFAFVFCGGEELYDRHRFNQVIRSLKLMGRLKKKGIYHMQIKNFGIWEGVHSKLNNPMGR